jgi:ABC-type Fe2+-enterobactin transport system substrate-binding protein
MKTLSLAVITGLLLAVSAPAFAADPATPTTKADCEKAKGTWDDATKACLVNKK